MKAKWVEAQGKGRSKQVGQEVLAIQQGRPAGCQQGRVHLGWVWCGEPWLRSWWYYILAGLDVQMEMEESKTAIYFTAKRKIEDLLGAKAVAGSCFWRGKTCTALLENWLKRWKQGWRRNHQVLHSLSRNTLMVLLALRSWMLIFRMTFQYFVMISFSN